MFCFALRLRKTEQRSVTIVACCMKFVKSTSRMIEILHPEVRVEVSVPSFPSPQVKRVLLSSKRFMFHIIDCFISFQERTGSFTWSPTLWTMEGFEGETLDVKVPLFSFRIF